MEVMLTESNTSSDVGQNVPKPDRTIKIHKHGETRLLTRRETSRERMVRVVMAVQKKRKKGDIHI